MSWLSDLLDELYYEEKAKRYWQNDFITLDAGAEKTITLKPSKPNLWVIREVRFDAYYSGLTIKFFFDKNSPDLTWLRASDTFFQPRVLLVPIKNFLKIYVKNLESEPNYFAYELETFEMDIRYLGVIRSIAEEKVMPFVKKAWGKRA